jgi:hypothetical protein
MSNSQWSAHTQRETCSLCGRAIPQRVTVILRPRALLESVTLSVTCQCGASVPWPLTHVGEGKESTVFVPDDQPPPPHLKVVK